MRARRPPLLLLGLLFRHRGAGVSIRDDHVFTTRLWPLSFSLCHCYCVSLCFSPDSSPWRCLNKLRPAQSMETSQSVTWQHMTPVWVSLDYTHKGKQIRVLIKPLPFCITDDHRGQSEVSSPGGNVYVSVCNPSTSSEYSSLLCYSYKLQISWADEHFKTLCKTPDELLFLLMTHEAWDYCWDWGLFLRSKLNKYVYMQTWVEHTR